ncbi:HTH-type transcriptional regulator KmtR [Corynebacterium ciconiae DSM 44920]|uniref:ArsR/SmtB family transcription factor n=1 Tax=Corynebacterium ciconiae TaxID=227319 RepID=UPI00037DC03F|nr:metalloregulator ArsR/SmtB family transcription factor [Corynebacterium ciconiae]WKD60837.1 HTH-type transcriptional regulator KmtR [Corynebacterium ciconiae DSM 44920]
MHEDKRLANQIHSRTPSDHVHVPAITESGALELAAAEVLKLLADPTRIRIILTLGRAAEISVNEISATVGKRPATVSQHLAKMRLARMVTTRHQGTSVYYALTDEHAIQLISEAMNQAEHAVSPNGLARPHQH